MSDLSGKTVLYIAPLLDGSIGQTIVALADTLIAAGARVLVACDGGPMIGDLQAKGAVALDMPLSGNNPLRLLRNSYRLRRLLRENAVDLIHAWTPATIWAAAYANRTLRLPLFASATADPAQIAPRAPYRSALAACTRIAVPNHHAAAALSSAFPAVAGKIMVVPRAFDLAASDPSSVPPQRIAALRAQWQLQPDSVALLVTGMADNTLLATVMDRLKQHGGANIKHIPLTEIHDPAAAFLAATALLVFPGKAETGLRQAIEAQAFGLPVMIIGSDALAEAVNAPPDIASAERTGWRVAAGDGDSLALALAELLAMRPSLRGPMAERARRFVLQRYTADAVVQAIMEAYLSVTAAP